jgi:hypothetical protein
MTQQHKTLEQTVTEIAQAKPSRNPLKAGDDTLRTLAPKNFGGYGAYRFSHACRRWPRHYPRRDTRSCRLLHAADHRNVTQQSTQRAPYGAQSFLGLDADWLGCRPVLGADADQTGASAMKTLLTAAAFVLLATASSEAQTDHRDRARERFCITRGGCSDHETTMKCSKPKTMLDAQRLKP